MIDTSSGQVEKEERPLNKAFRLFEEDIFRMLKQRYAKERNKISWAEYVRQWEERVKDDALRLRNIP